MNAKPERIYLVGMPGSGKSTSGPLLARLLGWTFGDLDARIASVEGASVADLFARGGEASFREAETRTLHATLAEKSLVLATGGGTVLQNMDWMLKAGTVVWLDLPMDLLLKQLGPQAGRRPLLLHLNTGERELKLWDLYRSRLPLYSRAHCRVQGTRELLEWGEQIRYLP
jgi:shikimate kinase